MDTPAVVGLTGTAYGVAMTARFAATGSRKPADRYLLALLLLAGAAAVCIVGGHSAGLPVAAAALPLEHVLSFLAGPLVYSFAASRLVPRWTPPDAWGGALLGCGVLLPVITAVAGLTHRQVMMPLVALQIAFTIGAARLAWRAPAARQGLVSVHVLLAMMAAVHAGQLLRFSHSHWAAARNIVPLAIGCSFLLLGLTAQWREESLPAEKEKYAKTSMDADHAARLAEVVGRLMTERALYRDPNLTLAALADAAGTSRHLLSQLLNDRLGTTFNAYVARFRIEEVQRELLSPDGKQKKIDALALDCGFASRSAFYETFRQATGLTPSEFRRLSSDRSTHS